MHKSVIPSSPLSPHPLFKNGEVKWLMHWLSAPRQEHLFVPHFSVLRLLCGCGRAKISAFSFL